MNRPTAGAATLLERHPEAGPFALPGRDEALLVIHGFTGTPGELRPIGDLAHDALGWTVEAPLLPGHGTTPADLAPRRLAEWTNAVEGRFRALRAAHARVHVAGLSMGGLLALRLLRTFGDAVASAVLLAPVVALRPPLALAMRALPFVPGPLPRIDVRKSGRGPAGHVAYDVYPLPAVRELARLQREIRRDARAIATPTLIGYSTRDEVVDDRAVEGILPRFAHARTLRLERSGHILPLDCENAAVLGAVEDFYRNLSR